MTRARRPARPPRSRPSRSTAREAAERGTPVRRTLVLSSLPAAAASRNRVSSTPSAAPASRAAAMAPFTWVRIWSSPQIWERSPPATSMSRRAASSPAERVKYAAKGAQSTPAAAHSRAAGSGAAPSAQER